MLVSKQARSLASGSLESRREGSIGHSHPSNHKGNSVVSAAQMGGG